MSEGSFISTIKEYVDLPEEIIEEIVLKIKKESFPKRTVLLKPGQVCEYVYFVGKGLGRTYFISGGKEMTTDLSIDGEFFGEFTSFFSQKPSNQYIELLEDSELYFIHHDDLQELYDKYPLMSKVGRVIAERHYIELSEHSYSLKFNTTTERYNQLFNERIEIIRRAPIGVIASYLGMSIENLSRIRRRVDQ